MNTKTTLFASLAILLPFLLLSQTTRRVPADYATVQAAIDAAQTGDTVLLSPGTYTENLQLQGRDIVLTSRFRLDADPAIIAQTVIDGSQPVHPDTASCLLIWKHETAATVVEGLTFTGGKGTVWLDPAGAGTFREGGGILTEFSSPVIRHCILRDNLVSDAVAGQVSSGGGGIRSGEGAPLIENCLISGNAATGYGGGIVLNFCPGAVVRNNIIVHNKGGKDYSGGGFWATGENQNTVVILKNNVIAYNDALGGGGQWTGKGGGIWVFSIKCVTENNIVWGNTQQAGGKQINGAGGNMQAKYNCVQDGFSGPGNVLADPRFADTLCFLLSPGSPCVDAGNPDAASQDFSENNLRAAYPARGGLRNDMGAYGGPGRGPIACYNPFETKRNFTAVLNSPVSTRPGDSRSVNWVDIDGDKDLDLMITNGPQAGENNFLYKNDGAGGFTAVSGDPIVQDFKPSDGATWADADNDGDLDCFVVNWYGVNNLLYRNNGDGSFAQITTGAPVTDGGFSETASWGDYDQDGLVDLYVTNSGGNKRNFLYRNLGNFEFSKVTTGSPVVDAATSRCVNWTDYDSDGDPDIFVTNEEDENENLYRNNGDQTFTKVSTGALLTDGGKTMSASWGDYDNDGDQDVFLANDQANDALFRNEGNGIFTKISSGPVVNTTGNTFGSEWADVDNDGDLDLFATNSFWGSKWHNYLYLNDGAGNFTLDHYEVVSTDDGWSYGAAFGDFDRDGDLDLSVANCYAASQPDHLYENHAAETPNHWLVLECTGTTSNRSAIGAKVRVKAIIAGQPRWQMREISAQSGYCGQNQLAPHFGLGDATLVDSLVVEWPSGQRTVSTQVFANQYVAVTEGQDVLSAASPSRLQVFPPSPNPFHGSMQCSFELFEPTKLTVEVVDLQGKPMRRLAQEEMFGAGKHTLDWNGKAFNGAAVPAGSYAIVFRESGKVSAQVVVKLQ